MIIISFWVSQGGRLRLDDGLLLQPWTEFHMLCRHLHVVVSETSVRVRRSGQGPSESVRQTQTIRETKAFWNTKIM